MTQRPLCATISEVRTTPAGEIVLIPARKDLHTPIFLTPAKAQDLAGILNAAAAHAEKETS